jgi:succinate dehydrogenase / fumarate reductase cytochrome b subunit
MIRSEPRGCGGKCGCSHRSAKGMSAAEAAPATAAREPVAVVLSAEKRSCACKMLRPYRRVHSLAGLIFAAFLGVHFLTGASALSPPAFEANANHLRTLTERFPVIEFVAVLVPLLVLLALGTRLLIEAGLSPARKRCNRGGKIRYFLQRISALVILSFIVFHVGTMSRWGLHGGLYDPARPFASVAASLHANAAIATLYLLAIAAVSYHLANGLWTGAIAWGAITSERAKRNWQLACAAFGVALCSAGIVAWYAFVVAARNA